ncbi:Microtubule-associated protein [Komagataella phaffii]|uniref:Microtubule-associated protein (MAP) of the XMAP215/Dis1 family n=1 Tax=Komagataella phaffii (strain GS115 / ATCC 20864) TaxID=644223 RepID=C4R7E3_KOMPG|nr:Microtubule-associated protein (MAP) of the XMAP215/Dis1 family [Komagataella phaffii GS115]CAH2451108.1 Putative microtubule-associated protein [Komagataella phaffii CBS 7435]CAY71518.1 Microtubule-associated protein (MAP) of the XMAP215/Dis1 family [Komagataella phaffii GS115]
MDSEEPDYSSLPLKQRILHKNWKCRLTAYEEIQKLIDQDDSKEIQIISEPELLRKIVTDSNVVAQEAGVAALCKFIQFVDPSLSLRTRDVVVPSLIEKTLASTRAGTKSKSIEALELYVELEDPEPVVNHILPFLQNRLPKLVAGSVEALVTIYQDFGAVTVSPKLVFPSIPKLFSHADKNVRAQVSSLSLVLYQWIGDAFKDIIFSELKPIQQKDLTKAFESLESTKPVQKRFLRSQQANQESENDVSMTEPDIEPVSDSSAKIDAYDLMEPQNILSLLPSDLDSRASSAKWKDRVEVLEEVQKVVAVPRMASGDYTRLVRILGKSLKDANVQVVQLTATILFLLAKGLRGEFEQYLSLVLTPLLERTKEKKPTVLVSLCDALNACFESSSLSAVMEETVLQMANKTPQVKVETTKFLIRCLKNSKTAPSPQHIDLLIPVALKLVNDSQAPVRNAGFEVVGTLMKIVGPRPLNEFMDKIDDRKRKNIMEFCETAEVSITETKKKQTTIPSSTTRATDRRPKPSLGPTTKCSPVPSKRGPSSPLKRAPSSKQSPPSRRAIPSVASRTNGLTNRSLTTARSISRVPDTNVSSAERLELENLRKEKKQWEQEKEKYEWRQQEHQTERVTLMKEINNLQEKTKELLNEETDKTVIIKSKDTQIDRLQHDLDLARERIRDLENEYKTEGNGRVNTFKSDAALPADPPGRFSPTLSDGVDRLSLDHAISEHKENLYGTDYSKLLDSSDESWRRAAEVTFQLKARIEKMKARSKYSRV